jgi:ubiquinone/menaquinone biosynthesis C-methylase UbiE
MNNSSPSFSGSIPRIYDEHLGPLLFEPYALDLMDRIKKKPASVLEIACGTGIVTSHLRRTLPSSSKLTATDISQDMISIARSKLADKRIEWKLVDAQKLPFDEESFDLVISQFGYMFVPDKPKAFSEIFRVMTPGGILMFNTWDKIEHNRVVSIANKVINSYFANDPTQFYQIQFSMYNPDEIKALLKHAGFHDIKIELVKKEGKSSSASHAAVGFVEGNPVYTEIMSKIPSLEKQIIERVTQSLAENFGDAPMTALMQAYVVQCRK